MRRTLVPDTSARRVAGVVGVTAVLVAMTGVLPAVAIVELAANAPTTTVAVEGVATPLEGMSIVGGEPGEVLAVTAETSSGEVQVDTSSGIALAYGNDATGSSVSFTGSRAQVNAALAGTDLLAPAGSSGGSATVTLTVYPQQEGIVFGPATGHFYEFVPAANLDWDSARSGAAGRGFLDRPGYLVTITSSAENAIVTSRIPQAQNVWIGATATGPVGGYAREWRWDTGPEAGTVIARCLEEFGTCEAMPGGPYVNWATGEPNNQDEANGGEWVAVTNWNSFDGLWNDLAATNTADISGYVVEYGDTQPFVGITTASSTVAFIGVPGAPTGVSAVAGPQEATVSFTAPASTGGAAITSYTVTASPGGATATCASSPCTITGLTAWTPYTFVVSATNAIGTGSASGSSAAVTVEPFPYMPSLPSGPWGQPVVGQAFTEQITATGFPAPTFAVTAGALPAGLVMAADGTITGTPTTPGYWSAQITATNSEGSMTAPVSGFVGQAPTAITGTIGVLAEGTAASIDLDADGYPAPAWSVTAGALPDGLDLGPANGTVTGTPTTSGPYSVTVTATNAYGAIATTLTGWVSSPPELIAGTTPQLLVGVPASVTYTVDGYPAPTFAVTAGAPPAGMTLSSAGVLSGTPSAVGTWSARITATNDRGSLNRVIGGYVGDPPSAVSGALADLDWGSPVIVQLSSYGYPTPTFAVTAGALPAGLTLTAAGLISGTPTAAGPYSVTIAATNGHGTQTVVLAGSVDPVPPSAPAGLVAAAGDGAATLTFDAPDSDGGAPVTGYEVRVDSGAWQALDATTDGSTVRGTVPGLFNGVTVDLRVRAVNTAGASLASGRATVTPVAPPPSPVAAPTAVAGTSSVTVSWTASTARDVTGYTVTASVGPAMCHVDADTTSCVLGAVAGQAVTFRVVTHSRWGDSAPSAPSAPVVPRAPDVPPAPPASARPSLTTTRGPLTTVTVGESITLIGRGFAPFSTATVVVYSEPRVLGTVVTDLTGAFSLTIAVPTDLESGDHTFVALGTDPAGDAYALRLPVAVPVAPVTIAETGTDAVSLALASLTLVLCGTALHRLGARRARRSAA